MTPNPAPSMTIGRLARAAGVGIETIRYYQQRGLLPVPAAVGAFRRYSVELTARIRFVKRAQELGFSLDEIAELLRLEDGTHRESIRQIASARLDQIEHKLLDLKRMQKVLTHLVAECEHTRSSLPCPIIAALEENADGASATRPGRSHRAHESRAPASARTARQALTE